MVSKCQPWLSPLFCFIQSTGCWGSDLDISSHMKTGAPHNTLWKPSASGHVTDSSGQEKTISKQHWQQASWTETKPVVGKAHNCPTRVLSPTSQTKKKKRLLFQSLYWKHVSWGFSSQFSHLRWRIFGWHVANRCKAKDRRRHVDFTSNVTNLVMTSVEGLQKLGILPLWCGVCWCCFLVF